MNNALPWFWHSVRVGVAAVVVFAAAGCTSLRRAPAADAAPADAAVPADDADTNVTDVATVLDEDSAYPHVELLARAMLQIRKYYVEEKSYKDITYGAIHGMLQGLDEHSSFLEAEDYEEMQEDTSGKFSGIGVTIGASDGVLTVIAPIEDTPAYRAGLQTGDRIIEIDGEKTTGVTLRDAVKKLRGDPGTKVTITVQSADGDEQRTVEIVRDDIVVPSVKGVRIVRDGVGYIRLTQFAKPTTNDLQLALDELAGQGMNALVLDLRGNPGGLLSAAVGVAEKFLEKGDVIVTTRGRPGVQDEIVTRAGGDVHLTKFPMVILVNGGSASASEIVAGALKDHHRAVLVGTRTFGKASVQSVIPINEEENVAVRLTIAYYYTPSGALIHKVGIMPDIEIELSPAMWRQVLVHRAHTETPELFSEEAREETADVVDIQLERAVDLLQGIRIFQ